MRSSTTVVAGPLARWRIAILPLVVVLALCLIGAQLNPYLGDYGDDAEFLVLGQGLVQGAGYVWANSPERAPHNRYPPGYPLLLAGTMLATGTRDQALAAILPAKLVTAASHVAAMALVWLLARRRLPGGWAVAAVAAYAFNPFAIRFAVQIMSDVPYILALLGALVWAEAAPTRRPVPLRHWLALGALLALGAYVRTIGDVAAVGVIAWAWWRAGRRAALAAAATFLACMIPGWLRDLTLSGGWRYAQELLAAQYQDPSAGVLTPAALLRRALDNGAFIIEKPGVFGAAGFVLGGAAAAVTLLGYWRCLRLAGGAAEWVAVPLVLAVLVWPIKTGRYLLPVVPLAGIYAIAGGLAVAGWLAARQARRGAVSHASVRLPWRGVLGATVAGIIAFEAAYATREAMANVRALAGMADGQDAPGYYRQRPDWAHYLQAAEWLRANAGPHDVAMARRHFALYVYSGHLTDKYRYDVTPDELDYLFSGTQRKFIVEDAFDVLRGDFAPLPAAVRARGGDLVLRFETGDPTVRVWELVRPGEPGDRGGAVFSPPGA
jgi:hypothetical protein